MSETPLLIMALFVLCIFNMALILALRADVINWLKDNPWSKK